MEGKFNKKDYEMISDYLDQRLESGDILDFARRLSEDPELSTETEELMRVKTLIREMPEVTPPHNYTLTTIEAREARRPGILERLFPFFRTAAAFCCLALIASFVIPQMKNAVSLNQAAEPETAAKSIQLDEMMLEESSSEIFTDSYVSEVPAEEPEQTYKMPSHGVRGGTPKNEFMMDAERINPGATDIQMHEPDAVIILEESAGIPAPARDPLPAVRTAFLAMILIAAVWMFLTMVKRNRLKLKD